MALVRCNMGEHVAHRSPDVGDIVVVKLNKDGTVKSVEPFLTGFIANNNDLCGPVDVLRLKDGSPPVADDWNGAVYRISYGKPKTASR